MKKIIRLTENDLVRLTKKIINETKKEKDSGLFYDSNKDKFITPKEKGWYVGFRTKSGDVEFVKVDREPKDKKDAMNMLKEKNPDEEYSIVYKIVQVK